jgi:uncharacterized membrane protein (DUF106 family)
MTNISIKIPGGGLCTILTIIFVIAKIAGYITWSWWLVFGPMWIPLTVMLSIIAIVVVVGFFCAMLYFAYEEWDRKRRYRKRMR